MDQLTKILTLFKMGFFGAAHGWWGAGGGGEGEGQKGLNLSHISYNDETWNSYTLPKKDPKNIWIRWHIPWVLLTPTIFQRKSANFAISISRNTYIDRIFNVSWVFKDCFNKESYNFDDLSKNGCPRHS